MPAVTGDSHGWADSVNRVMDQTLGRGDRFAFGENWRRFLAIVDEGRISEAERSLRAMLDIESLRGRTFLDVGSGSGLFSLAARRLGATVRSFDIDPASVRCAEELRRRFLPDDPSWSVETGSILDENYVRSLGQFEIVYSWGVLHHTGAMWEALDRVGSLVRPRGVLFIAIYNDQGRRSAYWRVVKRTYCRSPRVLRPLILLVAGARLWGPTLLRDLMVLRPFRTWRSYGRNRGMSPWRDVVDWVGGYPFEVAKPDDILDFFRKRGFVLRRLRTVGGSIGNNQYVFERNGPSLVERS